MSRKKNVTQYTLAFKQRLTLGAALSEQLQPQMTLKECAQKIGISWQAVRKCECLALAKVATAIKEHALKLANE